MKTSITSFILGLFVGSSESDVKAKEHRLGWYQLIGVFLSLVGTCQRAIELILQTI
jgi:hypothetical protein